MKAIAITSSAIPQEALLRSALERIHFLEHELQKLRTTVAEPNEKIRIHQANRVITASPKEILYIQSADNYSRIFMKDGGQYYTSRTLKSWVDELPASGFLRCHRTYLVNRAAISEVNRLKNVIVLQGGTAIPTSRRFQKGCISSIFSNTDNNGNQSILHQPVIHQLTSRSISPLG
jgi:DNA-binding LytR/AlgR family response regulator